MLWMLQKEGRNKKVVMLTEGERKGERKNQGSAVIGKGNR